MAAKKKVATKAAEAETPAVKKKRGERQQQLREAATLQHQQQTLVIGQAPAQKRQQQLHAFKNSFNTTMKAKLIVSGNEAPNTYLVRTSTGISTLDRDLGGGWPAGTINVISGPDNSGKTFLAKLTLATQQRLFGPNFAGAWAPIEGGFDYFRAKRMGLRVAVPSQMINELEYDRKSRGLGGFNDEEMAWLEDSVGTFDVIRGRNGEETMAGILEAYKTGLYQVIVGDSFSMLLPETEVDKDFDDASKVAARASLVTRFIGQYSSASAGVDRDLVYTTILAIAQVRANQKQVSYGREWRADGAWALRHGKSIDLVLTSGERRTMSINGETKTIGKEFKWETLKGKHGTHDGIKGSADLFHEEYLPHGIDVIGILVKSVVDSGDLEITKDGYNLKSDLAVIPKGIHTHAEFAQAIAASPALEFGLRRHLLSVYGLTCILAAPDMYGFSCLPLPTA